MIAYENMTPEEQERYREARMTNGQRWQEREDQKAAEKLMLAIAFGLVWAVYLVGSVIEMLVL